jgi:hypothetical protein
MNFYLAALDDLEREPDDSPSIGLSHLIRRPKAAWVL